MKKGYAIKLNSKAVTEGHNFYYHGITTFDTCNDIKVFDNKPRILVYVCDSAESSRVKFFETKEAAESFIEILKTLQLYELKFMDPPPEGYRMEFEVVDYQSDEPYADTNDFDQQAFFEQMEKCWETTCKQQWC